MVKTAKQWTKSWRSNKGTRTSSSTWSWTLRLSITSSFYHIFMYDELIIYIQIVIILIFVSPLTFLRCIAQSLWQFAAQLCPLFSTLSVNKKVFCSFRLGLSRSLPRREKARKWVKLRQIICLSNLRRKIWKKEKENRKQINCATPQNRLEITRCWHTDMKPWKA